MLQLDEPFVDPITPVKQWKMNTCKEWLSIHGICNNGKVNELRQKIIDYKKDDIMLQKVDTSINCGLEDINNCIGSLFLW